MTIYCRKKKRKGLKKVKEKVDEVVINDDSDFLDLEASDFDLSADEIDEELQENKASSLLDIVSGNLDRDCSDGSDMEEDILKNDTNNVNDDNNMDQNIEKEKETSEEDDMEKLEIYDSKKPPQNLSRKKSSSAGIGG